MTVMRLVVLFSALVGLAALLPVAQIPALHAAAADGAHAAGHGAIQGMSVFWIAPFVLLLLSIAILPLVAEHWWEHNSSKAMIAVPLGLLVAGYLAGVHGGAGIGKIAHAVEEYIQFITLLGSLYIVSGGIVFRGTIMPTPKVNVSILAVGAAIASFVGTTGASMLLIRPLLRANLMRKKIVHTCVFFIFIVSNIGGCLTPLGDPPLFLGFLRGVPFEWCFNLWPEWLLMNSVLLVIYFIWDSIAYKSETIAPIPAEEMKPVEVAGKINFVFLAGVVLSVAFLTPTFLKGLGLHPFCREIVMGLMIVLSLKLTPKGLREENQFNYHPITEVAVLFIGIFLTMIPALNLLQAHGPELGVNKAWQFFLYTGLLSSFLDNAPTYVVFFELAGTLPWAAEYGAVIANGVPHLVLVAISLGSVFMGANTYIGNGPNFMVKAICEQAGIKMPSFFGYMAYSFGLLMPLFIILKLIWFPI